MEKISRTQHRQRAKQAYLNYGADSIQDHNLLEMILFYAIPRRDVKPIAYNLINRFGSIENVFSADISELTEVNGVGESTAILLNLIYETNKRCNFNKNKEKLFVSSHKDSKEFVTNILKDEKKEKFIALTLTANNKIINYYVIGEGEVDCLNVDPKVILKYVLSDSAPKVIIAHNHPQGSYEPSKTDLEFTKNLSILLNSLNIKLFDHIIVGENGTLSLSNDVEYFKYL